MKEVAIAPRARAVQPTLTWEVPRSAYPVRESRWNVGSGSRSGPGSGAVGMGSREVRPGPVQQDEETAHTGHLGAWAGLSKWGRASLRQA
jgi:hypothetical protein